MTRYRILPYKSTSRGAKVLAEELDGKRLLLENSEFTFKPGDVVINWGNGHHQHHYDDFAVFLNPCRKVYECINKLTFFQKMQKGGVTAIPEWWTTPAAIPADAYPVVCRTVLEGKCAEGVVIAANPAELVDAKLYTKFITKTHEYRLHLGRRRKFLYEGGTFMQPQAPTVVSETTMIASRLRYDWKDDQGAPQWAYDHVPGELPQVVFDGGREAFEASDLDFAALDILYDGKADKAYVLEINTAPDLRGKTPSDYADFFRSLA